MPFPILSVPHFPNVPQVPGVPPLLRDFAQVAANQLVGTVRSTVNLATNALRGTVAGIINQPSGLVTQVTGNLSGSVDPVTGAVAGAMSALVLGGGSISANLAGVILGSLDGTSLDGSLRSSLFNVLGSLVGSPQDAPGLGGFQAPVRWGVFDANGFAVIRPDSVVEFDQRKDYRISDFPVEQGTFESYNKVQTPGEVHLVFSKGGTDVDRAIFLEEIDAALASLELYTIVMPEKSYYSMNADHVDFTRTAKQGATLLQVGVWFRQIRVSATATYTQTKTPAGASTVNDGAVQASTPSASQLASILGLF